jgi:hypothetical protein
VHGVSQRIENSGDMIGNGIGHGPDVSRIDGKILRETAIPVNSNYSYIPADMTLSGAAEFTYSAGNMPLRAHSLPYAEVPDRFTEFHNLTLELVPGDKRGTDTVPAPLIPVINVYIGPTDARCPHFYENFIFSYRRYGMRTG